MSYLVSAGKQKIQLNETDKIASILQNVAIILGTPKGSVPMYRDFGLSTQALDRPIPVAKTLLTAQVKEAVEQYEPRVRVVQVRFETEQENPGHLIPTVEVELVDES